MQTELIKLDSKFTIEKLYEEIKRLKDLCEVDLINKLIEENEKLKKLKKNNRTVISEIIEDEESEENTQNDEEDVEEENVEENKKIGKSTTKKCKTKNCNKEFEHDKYVTCDFCREKDRTTKQKRKERQKAWADPNILVTKCDTCRTFFPKEKTVKNDFFENCKNCRRNNNSN